MQDPFVGTWKLNIEKSEFDPNHRPTAGTMVIELDAESGYLTKAEGVNAGGEKVTERPQRLIPDGKGRPLPDFPSLIATSTRPDPNTLEGQVRREDGSLVGQGVFVVAADGKSMTSTNSGFDAQLRRFEQRTVWDRQ